MGSEVTTTIINSVVSALAGGAITALGMIFALGWKFHKRLAQMEASNDRLWEKLAMLREAAEEKGIKIHDRPWNAPERRDD